MTLINFNKSLTKLNNYLNQYFLSRIRPMDFQKYINHDTTRPKNKTTNTNKKTQSKQRVIKFVGNMEENIKELLHGVNCHCGNKKQFYNILIVFANKIQKLRTERDHYKNTLKQYLLTINNTPNGSTTAKTNSTFKPNYLPNDTQKPPLNKLQTVPSLSIEPINKENLNPLSKLAKIFNNTQQKSILESIQSTVLTKPNNLKQANKDRNNLTAAKQPLKDDVSPIKETKTQDRRINFCYETNKKAYNQTNDQGSFSLNLSSFEQLENKDKQTIEFMKDVSSIMNETNLLESDDEEQSQKIKLSQNTSGSKILSKPLLLQEKLNKLKKLKQSTNFQEILLSLNDEDDKIQMKPCIKKDMTKKKQNPQEDIVHKKSTKKSEKINDKENMRTESCLKKYNICLEKLEEFIENKQCLKQLQKTQNIDLNLRNFKSISSCSLKKDGQKQYDSVNRANRPMRVLQERKFHFNI